MIGIAREKKDAPHKCFALNVTSGLQRSQVYQRVDLKGWNIAARCRSAPHIMWMVLPAFEPVVEPAALCMRKSGTNRTSAPTGEKKKKQRNTVKP